MAIDHVFFSGRACHFILGIDRSGNYVPGQYSFEIILKQVNNYNKSVDNRIDNSVVVQLVTKSSKFRPENS